MTFQAEAIAQDTGEIMTIGPRGLDLPGRVTRVSLELPQHLSFNEWSALGVTLKSVEGSIMWWLGDWWTFGEQRKWGDGREIAERIGIEYQTCRDAGWVSGNYDLSDRSDKLTWTHHRIAASLPSPERKEVLTKAEAEKLSIRETRNEVNRRKAAAAILTSSPGEGTCTVADLWLLAQKIEAGEMPPFGTIYADPPWLYDNQATRAATGNHYDGMTIEELCELPVARLSAENAHLHLWTTDGFLFECPKVFEAWGFEFRKTFAWVKPKMGLGNYWRSAHELMLTGFRGDAKRFNDHSLRSWLECDRGKHSSKPEQVRSMIERTSPGPYLELFARWHVQDWTVWGNQIERSMFVTDVKEVA